MTHTAVLTETAEAARILRAGGTVAMPTETVYGLAALASDEEAVRNVFRAKGRPSDHPLIIHVASVDQAMEYGLLTDAALALVREFWPGPLTILVKRSPLVPDSVTGGRDTVALRMPAHPVALELIELAGGGLVAPSANRFGHVSPTTTAHVLADLDGLIDAVLDGGACPVGVESTIVDCTGVLQVLRPGAVSASDITRVTGVAPIPPDGVSRAPGMLASHYAPRARVLLAVDRTQAQDLLTTSPAGTAVIDFDDEVEYAANLYSALRDADARGCGCIIAVLPPGDGIAEAVRDRLTKAAADSRG